MTPNPQDSSVALEVERAAFEAWFRKEYHDRLFRNMPDKSYNDPTAHATWGSWQARASQSDGTSGGWQPIETAPEGVLLVVGWLDAEDEAHPERHDFDYLEDGVWQKHSENVEYFQACAPDGSRGPKEQAPYTHFMPVGSIPGAPNQGENHVG